MKFKVGDKVKIVSSTCVDGDTCQDTVKYIGVTTTIIGVDEDTDGTPYRLAIDNEEWCERDLVSVNNGVNMSNIVKKIKDLALSTDDRALRKTGLVDECGSLTEEGREVLTDHLFAQNKAALVDVAKQVLEAEKKEKK
jgi:hypothetical protein